MERVASRVGAWAVLIGMAAAGCAAADDPADPAPGPQAVSSEPSGAVPSESRSPGAVTAPIAEELVKFASGTGSQVPWGASVTYSIAGERIDRFPAARAERRTSWSGCPAGAAEYEGRECPVSPLDTLATADEEDGVVYESESPETVGCNTYETPSWAGAGETVWIRPAGARDCFSDFAVALLIDPSGRITSLDFALSGP